MLQNPKTTVLPFLYVHVIRNVSDIVNEGVIYAPAASFQYISVDKADKAASESATSLLGTPPSPIHLQGKSAQEHQNADQENEPT